MKHLGHLGRLAVLIGLALIPASCGTGGTGGGGGGRMYVLTCVLGCNNGAGGQQVACGIVNTFENQDITIQFSAPVDLAYVLSNPSTFKVFESASGISPAGEILLDPSDAKRLIFRPALTFGPLGVPSFGFAAGASYQVEIGGVSQGDPPPYVQSVDGKKNESRLLCSITTDQGLTDPVPGDPVMQIFVDEIDPTSGAIRNVEFADMVGKLSLTSDVTFVFQDIMNLGTVVTPITGMAPKPGITVSIDPDGNTADPSDQLEVAGTYTFDVDQNFLRTTAIFTPSAGFPSGGALGERVVVINVPASVIDLKGNSVANRGSFVMSPEVKIFGTVTLPEPGGELFVNQDNLDVKRSGADWGETQGGRLKPGVGGGSGRLGDLRIGAGETVTLYTSPQPATGSITFVLPDWPKLNDAIVLGDGQGGTAVFTFKKEANADPLVNEIARRKFTSYSLSTLANVLNGDDPAYVNIPAFVFNASYEVAGNDTLRIVHKTLNATGNTFEILTNDPSWSGSQTASGPTLSGGLDAHSFGSAGEIGERQIVTNFDFQAQPGGTPLSIEVADGIFEFSYVDIAAGGVLNLMGTAPARLLARGQLMLQDQARIDLSGFSAGEHHSDGPMGQVGAPGGPGGSPGADGADRYDNSAAAGLLNLPPGPPFDAGIVNLDANLTKRGAHALGVGGTPGQDGGRGGVKWPTTIPTEVLVFGGLATDDTNCVSEQVGAPGSGGAYSRDGGVGVAAAAVASSIEPAVTPNTPPQTAGGDFAKTNLPLAGTLPLGRRTLDPGPGFLEGGSAGGGGGSTVTGTMTSPSGGTPNCIDTVTPANTPIVAFRSHSGAAGGAAGGALQAQAGRYAQIAGTIDATGGDGGGYASGGLVNGLDAAPGGAGSGGAVLLQADFLDVAATANMLQIGGGTGGLGRLHGTGERSLGGDGSAGIIRAESNQQSGSFFGDVAQTVDVYDPNVTNQQDPNDPGGIAAIHWLSVDNWSRATDVPGSFSAAQSCWMKPSGSFFALTFNDDTGSLGWDMDLVLDLGGGEQLESYRSSTIFGGLDPQTFWGELFTEGGAPGAPVVVRFQGAKSTGAITDPCNVDPMAPLAPIDPDSITPWVRHPEELNAFSPPPDMCRFLILFDASHADFDFIKGVTNVQILAVPD